MDPLSLAFGLANWVPRIAEWLGHDNAIASANKIIDIACSVTKMPSGEAALQAIKDNPSLVLALRQALEAQSSSLQALMAPAATTTDPDNGDVLPMNATMQQEAMSNHWPTYSWRPFIGFCFGIGLLVSMSVVVASYVMVMIFPERAALLDRLPAFLSSMSVLLAVPMPVLGIASYFRGKMQAGNPANKDFRG